MTGTAGDAPVVADAPHRTATKPRHKSRTHWFNLAALAVAGAQANVGLLDPLLGDHAYAAIAFALAVGNIILRELTTGPVGGSQ